MRGEREKKELTSNISNGSVVQEGLCNSFLVHVNLVHVRLLCQRAELQKPRRLACSAVEKKGEWLARLQVATNLVVRVGLQDLCAHLYAVLESSATKQAVGHVKRIHDDWGL